MIERINAFKTSTGEACATLEEAQLKELEAMIQDNANPRTDIEADYAAKVAGIILDHSEHVVDILTTTATSKPRARKLHGGKKERKVNASKLNAELQDMKQ